MNDENMEYSDDINDQNSNFNQLNTYHQNNNILSSQEQQPVIPIGITTGLQAQIEQDGEINLEIIESNDTHEVEESEEIEVQQQQQQLQCYDSNEVSARVQDDKMNDKQQQQLNESIDIMNLTNPNIIKPNKQSEFHKHNLNNNGVQKQQQIHQNKINISANNNQQSNANVEETNKQQFQDVIYNKICEIGRGQFGDVIQIIDFKDRNFPFYARKTFFKEEDYNYEKQNYIEIDYSITQDVRDFLMMMAQFNDSGKYFHQKLGFCSLLEFTKMRKQKHIPWRKTELYYIFKRLCQFVIKFSSLQEVQLDFTFHQALINSYVRFTNNSKTVSCVKEQENLIALMKLEKQFITEQNQNIVIYSGLKKNNDYEFTFLIKEFSKTVAVGIYKEEEENSLKSSNQSLQSKPITLKQIQSYTMNKETKKMEKIKKTINSYMIQSDGITYQHKQPNQQKNFTFQEGDKITIKLKQKNKTILFYKGNTDNLELLHEFQYESLQQNENYYPAVMMEKENDTIQLEGNVKSLAKYYHGDLKPSNVILTDRKQQNPTSEKSMIQSQQKGVRNQDRHLELKIIDFGGATSSLTNTMLTPLYFNSFKRKNQDQKDEIEFNSDEERFQGEIYSVLRTFMQICLQSTYQGILSIKFIFSNKQQQNENGDNKSDQEMLHNQDLKESKTFYAKIQNNNEVFNQQYYNLNQEKDIMFSFQLNKLNKNSDIQFGIYQKNDRNLEDDRYYLVSLNGDVNYSENTNNYTTNLYKSKIQFEENDIIVFILNNSKRQFQFFNITNPNIVSNPIKLHLSRESEQKANLYPVCIVGPQETVIFENGPILEKYFNGILYTIKKQKKNQFTDKYNVYSEEENIYILEGLKTQIFSDFCKHDTQFTDFIDYLKDTILQEKFTRESLTKDLSTKIIFKENQNTLSQIQDQFSQQMEIVDYAQESVIQQIIQQKVQVNNPLELVFQLKSYIPGTKCTKTEGSHDLIDLMEEANQFILDFRSRSSIISKQIFILVGDSGTGKSTFLNQIQHQAEEYEKVNSFLQIHKIKLGQYSSQQQLEKEIEQIYQNYYSQKKQQQQQQTTGASQLQNSINNSKYSSYTINNSNQSNQINQNNTLNLNMSQKQRMQQSQQSQMHKSNQQLQQQLYRSSYNMNNKQINNNLSQSSILNLSNPYPYTNQQQSSQFNLNSQTTIQQYQQQQIQSQQQFELRGVKLLFLLDGYDEITFKTNENEENKEKLDQKIQNNIQNYRKLDFVKIFKLDQYINVKLMITSRKENLPENRLNQIFQYDRNDIRLNQQLVNQKVQFQYICLFQKEQMSEFIDKYIESVNDGAIQLYVNKQSFTKQQYISTFERNKELEQMATNPLMLRIILEVLPKIQNTLEIQQENKLISEINQIQKKAFSKYNLYKQFIKNWISLKIDFKLDSVQIFNIAHQPQSVDFHNLENSQIQKQQKQNLQNSSKPRGFFSGNLSNENDKNKLKAKFRLYIFNRNLAMGLLLKNTQNFTKDTIFEILNYQNSSQNQIQIESQQLETFLQCSPLKKMGVNYEYIHKSVFEYYVADNFIQELKMLQYQSQQPQIPQIKIQVQQLGKKLLKKISDSQNKAQSQQIQQEILTAKKLEKMKLNKVQLNITHLAIIRFMQNYYFCYENQKSLPILKDHVLTKIMTISKIEQNKQRVKLISPNAATLFNAFNFSFSGLDLSNTHLEGAILQQAIMHKTNLQNANLRKTIFTDSILSDSNMCGSDITDADFGKRPDLKKQNKTVLCVVYSPHGKYIASGDEDACVTLYSLDNPDQYKNKEKKHTKGVNSICFSPDSCYLVSGSSDKSIIVWDTQLNSLIVKKNAHEDTITCVQFTQNKFNKSMIIASSSEDFQIIIWKFIVQKTEQTFNNQEQYFYEISVINVLQEHTSCVTSIVFFEDGKKLASGSEDEQGIVYIWEETKIQWNIKQKLKTGLSLVEQIAISPDNNFIIAGSSEEMQIWYLSKNNKYGLNGKQEWQKFKSIDSGASSVTFSSDGKFVASGERVIKVWNVESGELLQTLEGNSHVKALTFSPFTNKLENNFIVAAHYDNTIRIYNIRIGQQLKLLDGHNNDVIGLAISRDETYIASGGYKGHMKIWNLKSGNLHIQINGFHAQGVKQITFCEDSEGNQMLATVGGTVAHLWDIHTGNRVVTFYGHQESIQCISYNYQLKQLATGSIDNTIKIWEIPELKDYQTKKNLNYDNMHNDEDEFYVYTDTRHKIEDKDISIEKNNNIYDNNYKNIKNRSPDPIITYEVPSSVTSLSYSYNGYFLAAGFMDKIVRVYNVTQIYELNDFNNIQKQLEENEESQFFDEEQSQNFDIYEKQIEQENDELWERYNQINQELQEPFIEFNQEIIAEQDLHTGPVLSVAFLPDDRIVSGGCDKKIKVWSLEDYGRLDMEIIANIGDIKSIVYLPQPQKFQKKSLYIAAGGTNQQIKIWDLSLNIYQNQANAQKLIKEEIERNQPILVIQGHTGIINQLNASPSGQFLASGSKSLQIWKRQILKDKEKDLDYILDRNISRSQAFQCTGLQFTDQEINPYGQEEELTTNELNLLLLRQYSQQDQN